MGSHLQLSFLVLVMVTLATFMIPTFAQLTPNYYDKVCPKALPIIKSIVKQAIIREKRIGASLLRLHFHDCFVNVSWTCLWYIFFLKDCFFFYDTLSVIFVCMCLCLYVWMREIERRGFVFLGYKNKWLRLNHSNE